MFEVYRYQVSMKMGMCNTGTQWKDICWSRFSGGTVVETIYLIAPRIPPGRGRGNVSEGIENVGSIAHMFINSQGKWSVVPALERGVFGK